MLYCGIELDEFVLDMSYCVNFLNNTLGIKRPLGGARGVTVIVVGNEHDDTSSNPGRDRLHFIA